MNTLEITSYMVASRAYSQCLPRLGLAKQQIQETPKKTNEHLNNRKVIGYKIWDIYSPSSYSQNTGRDMPY
jgi:hypothetical protein